jgi:hypothetical protein
VRSPVTPTEQDRPLPLLISQGSRGKSSLLEGPTVVGPYVCSYKATIPMSLIF